MQQRMAANVRRRSRVRRALLALLVLPAGLVALAVATLFGSVFVSVPLPDAVGAEPTRVVSSNGEEIGTLQPEFRREDVPLGGLPRHVVRAVLAAEDAGFYDHPGVSVPGLARAAVRNLLGGEVSQGGSTISQQYIKVVTRDDDRTLLRKIREAALAVKLERTHSKDEILGFYLNSIYFGRGAYGIEAAARAYYGKAAARLSVAEAAQLAGIIPAPSAWDPAKSRPDADRRYRYVLQRMVDNGWLKARKADRLARSRPGTVRRRVSRFERAPFFLAVVEDELARRLGDDRIYSGLEVVTTLDTGVQRHAEQAYAAAFDAIEPTGALVALDPPTGGVRALVGGEDYTADQLNLAVASRQPGSTFKPFALAAFVEQGHSPETVFAAPAEETFATGGRPWLVHNYGGAGYAPLTLREATARSINTVYARVVLDVGADRTVDVARRAGIDRHLDANPSVVLGATEVSPLELAEAYNTFAAAGIHREPHTVAEVTRDGETIYRAPRRERRALPAQVAATVTDVLRDVITSGTGAAADIGRPAAGKTGTTDNHGNAWFAGYTPQLTAVVWMGNRDDNATMPGRPTGGGLPATTWRRFMAATLAGAPVVDFPAPAPTLAVAATPAPSASATPAAAPSREASEPPPASEPAVTRPGPPPGPAAPPPPVIDPPDPPATPTPTRSPSLPPPPTSAPSPRPSSEPEPEPDDDLLEPGGAARPGAGAGAERRRTRPARRRDRPRPRHLSRRRACRLVDRQDDDP